VADLFPVELEFVPRQQPRSEIEGLLAELRERGYQPHMARAPEWGDRGPADTLILWVPPGLHHRQARKLAMTTANWFRRRPIQVNRLSAAATIRVESGRSGHVLTEVPIEGTPASEIRRDAG
jgi:hypothetical protein